MRTMTRVIMAAAMLAALSQASRAADPVELGYATFLDPNNDSDPRVGAQARMIEAFEKQNPGIKIKIMLDPSGNNILRAAKTGAGSPDVARLTAFGLPEAVATGGLKPLDGYLAADKVSMTDWLIPFEQTKLNGHYWGMPQDFRIPILMYRKSLLSAAGVTPPTTWDEACAAGGKVAVGAVIGYAMPLGSSGGTGGAQALGEFVLSTVLAPDGKYFAPDGHAIAFSKATFVRAAQMFKDMYGKCKATPQTSVQFGYNEVHDGLRAGTVAMASFGLARFGAIRRQGAGDDLQWAPPPGFSPAEKQTVGGFFISINAKTEHPDEAWKFVNFMTSPAGEIIQAQGGEVVARLSAYDDPSLSTPEAANQKAWAALIHSRGQLVSYSVILTNFHEIVGTALQRMILRNGSPEAAYEEVSSKYAEAIAKVH